MNMYIYIYMNILSGWLFWYGNQLSSLGNISGTTLWRWHPLSSSQHYGNIPGLVHARFGLLIITYGHPGLWRSERGQNTNEGPERKIKSGFKKQPGWTNGSVMKKRKKARKKKKKRLRFLDPVQTDHSGLSPRQFSTRFCCRTADSWSLSERLKKKKSNANYWLSELKSDGLMESFLPALQISSTRQEQSLLV